MGSGYEGLLPSGRDPMTVRMTKNFTNGRIFDRIDEFNWKLSGLSWPAFVNSKVRGQMSPNRTSGVVDRLLLEVELFADPFLGPSGEGFDVYVDRAFDPLPAQELRRSRVRAFDYRQSARIVSNGF